MLPQKLLLLIRLLFVAVRIGHTLEARTGLKKLELG